MPTPTVPTPTVPTPTVLASASESYQAPAFRWYGYGTITPGSNPHAPEGRYPQTPTHWYGQTGATPGAFPAHASAIQPGNQIMHSSSSRVTVPNGQSVTSLTDPRRGIVPASAEVVTLAQPQTSAPAAPILPPTGAPIPGHVPYSGMGAQAAMTPTLPPTGAAMATASAVQPARAPVARAQSDAIPAASLASPELGTDVLRQRIAEACGGQAGSVEMQLVGQATLLVRFVVAQAPDAEAVANRIAAIPELAPYRVDFEVRVQR
jgi:hypothetical protein